MNPQLTTIGDALEHAVARQVLRVEAPTPRWRSRRVACAALLAVIALPAGAYAASALLTTKQVAASLPQGTEALIGTDPSCSVVTVNIEYHCILATRPDFTSGAAAPGAGTPGISPYPIHVAVTESNGRMAILGVRSRRDVRRAVNALHRDTGARVIRVSVLAAPHQAAPSPATHPASSALTPTAFNWTGTVEPTVDSTKHVNGGCRAQNPDGTSWDCYIGQAAVTHKIIGESYLGQYSSTPGVG